MKIILKYSNGYKWFVHNNIKIIGYFHDEKNIFYEKERLFSYFENINSVEELKSMLTPDVLDQLKEEANK